MSDETPASFQQFFSEQVENLTKTAFPQLSKFIDLSTAKQDEDKAATKVSNAEDDTGTPNRRRSSQNGIANEQVLDGLTDISDKLKIQSIVLVSQLEEQTKTNQILSRLADGGGGVGGSSGGNVGADAVKDAMDVAGAKSVGNFIKSFGSKLLGGASALLAPEVGIPVAVGAYALTQMGENQDTSTKYFKEHGDNGGQDVDSDGNNIPNATQAKATEKAARAKTAADAITNLQADLDRITNHLKKNSESEEERAKLLAEELVIQEKINALQKDKEEALRAPTNSGPHGNGNKVSEPREPVSVSTPPSDNVPVRIGSDLAPANGTEIPQGQTALGVIHHGGGTGGSAGGQSDPARGRSGGDRHSGAGGAPEHSSGRGNASHTGAPQGAGHANRGITADSVDIAVKLRDHLMKEYGLTKTQASGMTGVMGYESGNFHTLQEVAPVGGVGDGHRGGYGYAQWTGPRRKAFNAYIEKTGLDPKSYEANEGFMDQELKGEYRGTITALKKTNTLDDASKTALVSYEGMPDTAAIRALGGKPATGEHMQRARDINLAMEKRDREQGSNKVTDESTPKPDAGPIDNPANDDVRDRRERIAKVTPPTAPLPVLKGVVNDPPSPDIGLAAAQKMAQHDYDKLDRSPTAYDGNRDIGIQGHANQLKRAHGGSLTDTSKTLASHMVQQSNENAIRDATMTKERHSAVINQVNNHGGGGGGNSGPRQKSDRLSDKDVGSANPPAARLHELFSTTTNPKQY